MSEKTLHDQIVSALDNTVAMIERGNLPISALAQLGMSRAIIGKIREQQHYDPEVMALLDHIETLAEES